jgi:hypothetical protein
MARFHKVKLEIVRPGPPHNQLLSPLTSYMALCGEGSPITFHIDLEHHKLLSRLERLRYVTADGGGDAAVPNRVREAAVVEVGEEIAGVLAEIRSLLAEVSRARSAPERAAPDDPLRLVHLRLVLGGSELALLPFELALAPPAMPGEGLEFCLQLDVPVVPTRETRRSRPVPVAWDSGAAPRILVVAAAPEGRAIPLAAHLHALAQAIEPWVEWPPPAPGEAPAETARRRLELYKQRLRVLPDASIDALYELCARESFTHVHVLAHGDRLDVAGERRFGIALARAGDASRKDVVSGRRLAQALQAESRDGARRAGPVVVTLMTCDSGQTGSVLVPGGSVAHDLHAAGIPWVFASQFPLTQLGSVRLTEAFYPRLLRGDDPRQALYEVRRLLYLNAQRDHDWASLVAYATLPDDFEDQVAEFLGEQARRAVDVGLARADAGDDPEKALDVVQEHLRRWEARLPQGAGNKDRGRRARCYGIHGSTFKRLALRQTEPDRRATLVRALGWYRKAMDQWATDDEKHHWVATQALCLGAVLGEPADPGTHAFALKLASRDLASPDNAQRAWAHGSLAELELLGLYHAGAKRPNEIRRRVVAHCGAIVKLTGADSFQVGSTRRQFERYRDHWRRDAWRSIPEAAVAALGEDARA